MLALPPNPDFDLGLSRLIISNKAAFLKQVTLCWLIIRWWLRRWLRASAFIAVVVVQFYKDHPIAKVVLVVATGLFAVITSGAIIWNQHQIIAQRDADIAQKAADTARKKEIRETIGSYIGALNTLIAATADTSKLSPLDEANKVWFKLQAYLKDNLDQSYVTRMLDTSIVGPIGTRSGDVRRDNLWHDLYAASLRLEEFSRQLGA